MKTKARWIVSILLLLSADRLPTFAQWSSDPGTNLGIADRADNQDEPKVLPTSDGGCWIAWYDNDPSGSPAYGYDVRLQRLDRTGVAAFGPDGILIADLGLDWFQTLGFDVDKDGKALLAFLDDRVTGELNVTAVKIDGSGNAEWGATGVRVTSGAVDRLAPRIAATDDGSAVIAWTENVDAVLQKLDASGVPQWGPGVVIPAVADEMNWVSALHGSDNGSVILSYVRSTLEEKHLYANKFAAAGGALWGAGVPLRTNASMQIGYLPDFVTDGAGGAVFAWYDVYPLNQVRAQHIRADGTLAFITDGADGTLNGLRYHSTPVTAYNPATEETFMVWVDQWDNTEGVYGQKFDRRGMRLWDSEGSAIAPLGDIKITPQTWISKNGAVVAWLSGEIGMATDKVMAAVVDGNGDLVCGPVAASIHPADKSSLDSTMSTEGTLILVWSDARADVGDLYGQTMNPDCSFGLARPREVSPPHAAQPLVFADTTRLLWEDKALSGSNTFNIYRALAGDLAGGSYGSCLVSDLTGSTASDPDFPTTGRAFFYHVTGENTAGEGTMGVDGGGNERIPNAPCP